MYKFEIQGCLPVLIIGSLLIFIAFKLWFIIAIFILIYLIKNFVAQIKINIELKKKEKETLINAMKVLIKYMDDDEKMLKKSGIKSMCSDIEYLEGLQELQYRK